MNQQQQALVEQLTALLQAQTAPEQINRWLDEQGQEAIQFLLYEHYSRWPWQTDVQLWCAWLNISLPRWNYVPLLKLDPWPLLPVAQAHPLWTWIEQQVAAQTSPAAGATAISRGQYLMKLLGVLQRSLGYDLEQAWPLFTRLANSYAPNPQQFWQQQPIAHVVAKLELYPQYWTPELLADVYRRAGWSIEQAVEHYEQLSSKHYHQGADGFLIQLSSAELQQLLQKLPKRWPAVVRTLVQQAQAQADAVPWAEWVELINQHPEVLAQRSSYLPVRLEIYAQLWPQLLPAGRLHIARQLPYALAGFNTDQPEHLAWCVALYAQWRQELSAEQMGTWLTQLGEHSYQLLTLPLLSALWAKRQEWSELERPLVQHILHCYSPHQPNNNREYARLLGEMCSAHPELLAEQKIEVLDKVVKHLASAVLRTLLGYFTGRLGSKTLDPSLRTRLLELELSVLDEAGWMQARKGAVLEFCAGVVLHHSGEAKTYAERLLANKALPAAARVQLEERFQLQSPPELQAKATPKLSPQAQKVYQPEFSQWLAPLDENEILSLLTIAATFADEQLPVTVNASLQRASAAGRALLARHLLERWLAADGDPKQRWVTRLLPGQGDEGCVNRLLEAVRAWAKPRKARCMEAVHLLGRIGTTYALSQLQGVMNSKYTPAIRAAAEEALKKAAAARDLTLAQLCDRLVPDFGLGAGISLECGERCYQVQLQADFKLVLQDAQGKLLRSWPKQRAEDDPLQWQAAQKRFKELQKGLKTVLAQQQPRLLLALQCGQRWAYADWQEQFIQHPLLARLAQRLLWLAWDEHGQRLASLRIAEDFTLVNAEDDVLELPATAQLSLWHPVQALEGEAQAWQDYCADYQLELLVDPFQQPAGRITPQDMDKHGWLTAGDKLLVTQSVAQRLADRYGYRRDGGSDNAEIGYHSRDLPQLGLQVIWQHSGWMVFFDNCQVAFYGIEVRRPNYQKADIMQLPLELQATLLEQCQQWRAAAAE